ncbi:MAG: hypothetical protein IJJ86_02985 [Clostridia bacterium]|nr:hypothetical protein [Clostridia bacterium]
MKRLLIALLSLVLLLACVPTPEEEIVVNKQDETLEQKLHATPIPATAETAEPGADAVQTGEPEARRGQTFPAHWKDTVAVTDRLTVTIDAPIVTRADGVYPVYRTRERDFTDAEVLSILNVLLPKPVKRLSGAETKEMIAVQIENFNEEAARWQEWRARGCPEDARPDGEELTDEMIEVILNEYAEQLRLAPERDEEQPVSAFDPSLLRAAYRLENGKTAIVVASDRTLAFSIGSGILYTQAEYERDLQFPAEAEYDVNAWKPVTLSREAAEKTLWETLDRVDIAGFAIVSAQGANVIGTDGRSSEASGWLFTLARDYGGYPLAHQAQADGRIKYAEGDGFEANAPIPKEEIRVMISEDGVVDFTYGGVKQIVRIENENVELLPFEEIRQRAINGLKYGFAGYGVGENYTADFTVFKAVLTVYTLRIRNEDDYYEMPCWLLLFEHTLSSGDYTVGEALGKQYRALVINAVDGSIVNPKLGY